MKNIYLLLVVGLVLVGGAFYGGMKYQQSKVPTAFAAGTGRFRMAGPGGALGARANGGFTNGEVLSKDDKSLTLKLRDGGSKVVFYTSSTQAKKMADSTMADVTVGTDITVAGEANADGSITAQQVQIRPASIAQ